MPNAKWEKIESFGFSKIRSHWVKKFVLGMLAGFFVGIGFTASLIIGSESGELPKFFSGLIFCTGILMCMFVGANLFTANCASFGLILTKKIKCKEFFIDLVITFVSNYVGSILIALFVYGIGTTSGNDVKAHVIDVCTNKVALDWWKSLLSGIITNVLVVGCIITMITFENKMVGFCGTLVMITAFAVCGFQHVVANQFITTLGGLYGAFNGNGKLVGELFYYCLLCSGLGNLIGGVGLIYAYYLVWNKFNKTFGDK